MDSHTYNKTISENIIEKVIKNYFYEFEKLYDYFFDLINKEEKFTNE